MKTRLWAWSTALVLLLTVLLTVLFRDIARDWIAPSLARALWLGNLLLGAVPQIVLWALLLLVGFWTAGRSFLGTRKRRAWSIERAPAAPPGRVRTLLRWVRREPESVYFRQRLARRLVKLATELQAYRQRCTSERFDRRLDDLDAPPDIRAYLQAGMTFSRSGGFGSRFLRWLRPRRSPPSLDSDLESVVRFLEDQLEVHYGN